MHPGKEISQEHPRELGSRKRTTEMELVLVWKTFGLYTLLL